MKRTEEVQCKIGPNLNYSINPVLFHYIWITRTKGYNDLNDIFRIENMILTLIWNRLAWHLPCKKLN